MYRMPPLLTLLLLIAACEKRVEHVWLAGIGGDAFPLLPAVVDQEAAPPALLPDIGQVMHVLRETQETHGATVSAIEMEADTCMYSTQLTFDGASPNDSFFLAASQPIETAPSEPLSPDAPGLRDGIVQYLKSRGIAAPAVKITGAMKARIADDLNVVVVAEQATGRGSDLALPGDFSIVAVGKLESGRLTVSDAIGVVVPDGVTDSLPQQTHLLALPDYDTDGDFEVAASGMGYEWMEVSIYAVKDGKLDRIAGASCGS